MPRRIYTYQPDMPWHGLNLFVSLSASMLAAGFLLFFIDAHSQRARRRESPADNPWDAPTLEWATHIAAAKLQFRADSRRRKLTPAMGAAATHLLLPTACARIDASWW